ncbi:MAG: hypothetical protein OIN88_06995, partial [Candidatus Methanoperedens sp.]|nr:hypothetical protein [Candidatus Methanoperedens sp.]
MISIHKKSRATKGRCFLPPHTRSGISSNPQGKTHPSGEFPALDDAWCRGGGKSILPCPSVLQAWLLWGGDK